MTEQLSRELLYRIVSNPYTINVTNEGGTVLCCSSIAPDPQATRDAALGRAVREWATSECERLTYRPPVDNVANWLVQVVGERVPELADAIRQVAADTLKEARE